MTTDKDVALRGFNGAIAEQMLDKSIKSGDAILRSVVKSALERMLKRGTLASQLFDREEREELYQMVMRVRASGDILGRAIVHEKLAE